MVSNHMLWNKLQIRLGIHKTKYITFILKLKFGYDYAVILWKLSNKNMNCFKKCAKMHLISSSIL